MLSVYFFLDLCYILKRIIGQGKGEHSISICISKQFLSKRKPMLFLRKSMTGVRKSIAVTARRQHQFLVAMVLESLCVFTHWCSQLCTGCDQIYKSGEH